jgi:hypothetical protein
MKCSKSFNLTREINLKRENAQIFRNFLSLLKEIEISIEENLLYSYLEIIEALNFTFAKQLLFEKLPLPQTLDESIEFL